jgi:hypothetical protein
MRCASPSSGWRCWADEHSLSLALFAGYLVAVGAEVFLPVGTWWYDRCTQLEGACLGGFVMVRCARAFWEKDSDPTKPPSV